MTAPEFTQQQCYEHLLKNAFEGMFLIDPDGNFLKVNPAFTALLGYTDEEINRPSLLEMDIKGEINRDKPWSRLRIEIYDKGKVEEPATSFEVSVSTSQASL